jgi:hypothetical protein
MKEITPMLAISLSVGVLDPGEKTNDENLFVVASNQSLSM